MREGLLLFLGSLMRPRSELGCLFVFVVTELVAGW